jgi:hypothetical protein
MRWGALTLMLGVVGGCAAKAPPPKAAAPAPAPEPERVAKPSADEEMVVEGTLGSLTDDEIAGPFQRRWSDISRCYTNEKQKLRYLGGKIELKVRVGAAGEPKSVHLQGSTVGSWDAERCILEIARSLTFSKPHGGKEAEFVYPIEFRSEAPVTAWAGDDKRVVAAMPRIKKDVAGCAQKGAARPPAGMVVTVYVGPGGKIASAGLHADAAVDETLASCVADKARAWRLFDPQGRMAKVSLRLDGTSPAQGGSAP